MVATAYGNAQTSSEPVYHLAELTLKDQQTESHAAVYLYLRKRESTTFAKNTMLFRIPDRAAQV